MESALFVRGPGPAGAAHSPMGMDFAAYGLDADSAIRHHTGRAPLRWAEVLAAVSQAGMAGRARSELPVITHGTPVDDGAPMRSMR